MNTKKPFSLLLVVFSFCAVVSDASPLRGITGILEGRVRDRQSREMLVGVNVTIVGTQYGAASDAVGLYIINNVRAGVYEVRFSFIGYKTVLMKNVTILPDLRTRIDID